MSVNLFARLVKLKALKVQLKRNRNPAFYSTAGYYEMERKGILFKRFKRGVLLRGDGSREHEPRQ
jgi:hypothetical protein